MIVKHAKAYGERLVEGESATNCNGIRPVRVGLGVRRALCVLLLLLAFLPVWGGQSYERYALVLEDPPVAKLISNRKELRRAAAEDRRRVIEAKQASLRSELASRNIHVTGSVKTLLNAVFVAVPEGRVTELKSLAGVKRVAHLPRIKRFLDEAAELVNAPAAWNALGGIQNAGAGIKIGILDTGIDKDHPAFRDASLAMPAGYPKCRQQPVNDCAWTSTKIIVARSYVDMIAAGYTTDPAETSRPDDLTPRDRVGHGTAAATIAGGGRNTGPVTTITGIAPKAYLGSYKIFGSPGVNDFTFGDVIIQALEDAFVDGMDIVSLSLGSPAIYGPTDTGSVCGEDAGQACDVRAEAVQRAVAGGMTVVASAGNSGDEGIEFPTLGTVASPGTAPGAITVGAATNSHAFFQQVRVTGGGVPSDLQRIPALFGDGPLPSGTLTAPLRDVSKLGNDGRACAALAAGSLNGAIALIERGDCFFSVKVNNAQAAGAAGVVIYRTDFDYPFSPAGLGDTGIPAAMVGRTDGFALKDFLNTHPEREVTMDPALFSIDAQADDMADFSSRGPSMGLNAIKPEVVAVGTDMYTATQSYDPNSEMDDPSGYTVVQGTSFSGPMVAGAAALVKQRRPGLTPAQIKSAIVNTANPAVGDIDGPASVTAMGAGKLNVGGAVNTTIMADPATLSFGVIGPATLPVSLALRLSNSGTNLVNLNLAVQPRNSSPNASVTLSTTSVALGAGQQTAITVRLEGTQPPPGSYEGVIAIQAGTTTLRVPYLYLVGDGVPYNAFALLGDGFVGEPGGNIIGRFLAIKLLDRYGVPVRGTAVTFRSTLGGGTIDAADAQTDVYGIAAAIPLLGATIGEQEFTATAGGLTVTFNGTARQAPAIFTNGIVNAASFEVGQGLAPGSYASIYGQQLADATVIYRTLYLPLSLATVSVSFDTGDNRVSVPGRLHFVSPGQVNVQIPWELEGYNEVKVKVSVGDLSSAVYTVPLAKYSPAFFENPPGSGLPAALDEAYQVVTAQNPVERGKVVQLFLNGLGPVDNPQVSGEPTPYPPLVRTRDLPTVTIGGLPAAVEFSGLAPFIIGLYQVNVRVPAGLTPGNHPMVLKIGDATSKSVTLPVN